MHDVSPSQSSGRGAEKWRSGNTPRSHSEETPRERGKIDNMSEGISPDSSEPLINTLHSDSGGKYTL